MSIVSSLPSEFERININAAGIDIGAQKHYVAVPKGRDPKGRDVRHFDTFTADLYALVDWLKQCHIDTVAMESTGIYWIPLFEILEQNGFEVRLVNPRSIKHAPGRKSDVVDCQWIQQLHAYGLLTSAFRPAAAMRASFIRLFLKYFWKAKISSPSPVMFIASQ